MDAATARNAEVPPDPDVREDLIAEAKSAITSHPTVFLSGGKLVEVAEDRDRTWLVPLDTTRMRSILWLCGPWQAFLEENELRPPSWLPSRLLREESWPDARRLRGITDIPVLRPDGTVLTTPGYDEPTGLWFAPAFPVPELPASPTQVDARAAAEELNRILDAFPLVSKAHRSSMLAAMLTPLAACAIEGPAPLFLLDAPGDGLGATHSVTLLGRLLCGREITRMEKPSNERQFRRQLTHLRAPDNGLVLIEDAEEFRRGASLSTALLDWQWTNGPGRGERSRLTWFARGANADVSRQAAEGILPIRFFDTDDHARTARFNWPNPWKPGSTSIARASSAQRWYFCGRMSARESPLHERGRTGRGSRAGASLSPERWSGRGWKIRCSRAAPLPPPSMTTQPACGHWWSRSPKSVRSLGSRPETS